MMRLVCRHEIKSIIIMLYYIITDITPTCTSALAGVYVADVSLVYLITWIRREVIRTRYGLVNNIIPLHTETQMAH